jgi:endogenous inhibitor of DNA gyrase (YacG/DUF329 family)
VLKKKVSIAGKTFGTYTCVAAVDDYYADFQCSTCKKISTLLTHRVKEGEECACIKLASWAATKTTIAVEGTVAPNDDRTLDRNPKAFWRTVTSYVDKSHLPVIGCSSSDPDSGSGTLRRRVSDYLCDVEISTRRAIENDPLLYDAWCNLVRKHANYQDFKPVPADIEKKIINACGAIYRLRSLDEYRLYNTKTRLRAKDRVKIENDISAMKKEIAKAEGGAAA